MRQPLHKHNAIVEGGNFKELNDYGKKRNRV